ncbi:MAG: hypothetical protein L3K15_08595 [Thermoplasmata archaeon]|nr:hypothetical protein [Thermoplasmata archaeon]
MVKLSLPRLLLVLPLVGYTGYVILRPGLAWTPEAAVASVLAVVAGVLPVVAPRRWVGSWAPFAAILVGSAAATVTTLLPPNALPDWVGALFLALGVAGVVSVPLVAPLWASLARRSAASQLLLIVLGIFSTVLVVQAELVAQVAANPAPVVSLPAAVDNVDGAQAAAFVANVLGHGPASQPPLSSALDPVFVLVALVALAGALLSWTIPQTDRGVSLVVAEPAPALRLRRADPLRFVAPEERALLGLASAPARPPLAGFPGILPISVAAVACIAFVTGAALYARAVLPVLGLLVAVGVAAVYVVGRPPLGRLSRRKTLAPP